MLSSLCLFRATIFLYFAFVLDDNATQVSGLRDPINVTLSAFYVNWNVFQRDKALSKNISLYVIKLGGLSFPPQFGIRDATMF